MKYILILLLGINLLFGQNEKESKLYKVGFVKNWEPYYILDKRNNPTGYGVELFEKIAKKLNINYRYVYADDWDQLWNMVEQNQIDIIPNVGIALNRDQYLNFTQATDMFEIGLFKNKEIKNTDEIKSKKIGVVENNVCVNLIEGNLYKNKIVYKSFYNSLNSLNDNKIDMLCSPKPITEYAIKELDLKNIESFGEPLKIVSRAVGIVKEDINLLNEFDKELLKLKANGEYRQIYDKWFTEHKDIQLDYEELTLMVLIFTTLFFGTVYYVKSKDWILTKNQLKEKIEEIDNLHKRLFLAADDALAGYWEWNLDTDYLYLSKGWKSFLGYRENELENTFDTFKNVMHPDDFEPTMNIVNDYIKTKKGTYKTKFRLKHKDGTYKWVSVIGAISKENENIFFGFHIDIDDLTTTKETLIAQSKSAVMGEMIGLIAHQFKQPLSIISIIASDELVRVDFNEIIPNDKIQEDANQILKQVQYLSETIDTFKNFLRPDIEKSEVNINSIIEDSLKIIDKSLRNNSIKIIKELSLIQNIKVNSSELMQVFINLLNNSKDAFKINNIEEKQILIKTFQKENKIIVEIQDNAGGIEEDKIDNIFDAYFTTKSQSGGTGLGLYIVKTIIQERYNGLIKVENVNKGARFRVELPLD